MTATGAAYVGLDLGTSSLKGVVVDAAGTVLARARAPYPTHRPEPGAAEQEPAEWFAAAARVTGELATHVPPGSWAGLGLSGMLPTLVLADSGGAALGPAVTWQDARAERLGADLRAAYGPGALYELTGQWVDGRYLLPMALRRLVADPGSRSARWLLGAKDLLFGWLTGVFVTDPSTATGYGCYDLAAAAWEPGLLEGVPGLPALPEVLPSTTARPLGAAAADLLGLPQGLPVVLGAADSVLGAYGLGVREAGEVAYLAGSSTVILGVSPELVRDHRHRYLVTPLAVGAGWGLEMDLLSTGSALGWLAGLLGRPGGEAELVALAESLESAGGGVPTFLPYLAPGEQGALWDPTLTGSLVGLDLGHGAAVLARALLDGILVESRRCLSVLATASGSAGPVRLAGRWTTAAYAQDLADASGRGVLRDADGGDASARGAALLARLALTYGAASDPPAAEQPEVTAEPRPERAAAWSAAADRHDAVLRGARLP